MNDDENPPSTLRSGEFLSSHNEPRSIDFLFPDRAAEEFMQEAMRIHREDYINDGGDPKNYHPSEKQIFAAYERLVQEHMIERRRPGPEILPLLAGYSNNPKQP